jgi:murein DD-endopeptidase MepM/ murein hydrolase activator NlpD
VADGRVIDVVDHHPDNQDPTQPRNNNAIRLRHTAADGSLFYSMHLHHKQHSARVRVGEPVFAGQHLTDVGNAGISSDPHLHLCVYHYDPWGEFRTLPIIFPMHTGDGYVVEHGTAINGLRFVPAPLSRTVP